MDLTVVLGAITIMGTIAGIVGYFLMRQKFLKELEIGKHREIELAHKAYETVVLKEIGDRIGYSLDASKIVEIISGSLGKLLPYSTVSYIILDDAGEKMRFDCNVHESVSSEFISEVKVKMLAALAEVLPDPILDNEIDESVSGTIVDETLTEPVRSFFNLPILIGDKVVGLINVASTGENFYNRDNTEVLYRIVTQASSAVSKLQAVLENEKSKLLQAVQSLSDGLLMVDTHYRLAIVNKKLSSLLGITTDPTIFDIVNALSGQLDLRTKMEEAIASEGDLPIQEVTVKGKVLQVVASKVLGKDNEKPMGVVVLFHDITDAKSLEQLRQDFTSFMVHELRSPLTNIKSTVELLQWDFNRLKPGDLKKYITTIGTTSQSMLVLVSDILDMAKLEAGKFDIVCDSADVQQAILERVENFRPLSQTKNIKLSVTVEPNLPKGYFDKVRIKQVMNNLLSNAFKYTESGEVKVNVFKEKANQKEFIKVVVEDTGIGIEQDALQKLFSKFGQLEAGRSKGGLRSSGLGLYIAKNIVEGWGGVIGAQSQGPGMGSTFFFTVPVSEAANDKPFTSIRPLPSSDLFSNEGKNVTIKKVGHA